MNVPQDDLDDLAARALTLRSLVLRTGRQSGQQKVDALLHADTLFAALITRAIALGAADPYHRRGDRRAPVADVPLHLLDTPANRRYADTLHAAWEAALAVDRERYGENIGTDGCAQMVEMLLADVEGELRGPVGSGE